MKNTLILISLLIASLVACSNDASGGFRQFYKQYHDQDGVISFKLPAGLANFFIEDEDKEAKEFMRNADQIVFLISEKMSPKMLDTMNMLMPANQYPTIMEVKDGKATISFTVRQTKKAITEIIMTVVDGNQLVVMAIKGEFTQEDAKKLVKSIDVDKARQK